MLIALCIYFCPEKNLFSHFMNNVLKLINQTYMYIFYINQYDFSNSINNLNFKSRKNMATIINNSAANLNSTYVTNNQMHGQSSNSIISHNLLDEVKFHETFSTYKIFSLELISIFCNIRVLLENYSFNLSILFNFSISVQRKTNRKTCTSTSCTMKQPLTALLCRSLINGAPLKTTTSRRHRSSKSSTSF